MAGITLSNALRKIVTDKLEKKASLKDQIINNSFIKSAEDKDKKKPTDREKARSKQKTKDDKEEEKNDKYKLTDKAGVKDSPYRVDKPSDKYKNVTQLQPLDENYKEPFLDTPTAAYGAGAAGGATVGATLGALASSKRNRLRNSVIGGGLGAVAGTAGTGIYRNRADILNAIKKAIG